jgi:hypothetical protein
LMPFKDLEDQNRVTLREKNNGRPSKSTKYKPCTYSTTN